MYKESLPSRMKRARENMGYTQTYVADATGISQPIIANIELGKREPNIENLCTLIDFYQTEAQTILGTKK